MAWCVVMNTRQTLGLNLRRLRVERGLSQERLALASGIDRSYVGRIERGSENVTVEALEALATVLGVQVRQLFDEPTDTVPARLPSGRRRK